MSLFHQPSDHATYKSFSNVWSSNLPLVHKMHKCKAVSQKKRRKAKQIFECSPWESITELTLAAVMIFHSISIPLQIIISWWEVVSFNFSLATTPAARQIIYPTKEVILKPVQELQQQEVLFIHMFTCRIYTSWDQIVKQEFSLILQYLPRSPFLGPLWHFRSLIKKKVHMLLKHSREKI